MTTDNKNKQQKCDGITFTTDTIPLMWQLYCFFFLLKTLKQTSKEQYLYLKTFCKSQLKLYLLLGLQIQTAQLFKIIIQQPPFKRKQSFQNCRFFLMYCNIIAPFRKVNHQYNFEKNSPQI